MTHLRKHKYSAFYTTLSTTDEMQPIVHNLVYDALSHCCPTHTNKSMNHSVFAPDLDTRPCLEKVLQCF